MKSFSLIVIIATVVLGIIFFSVSDSSNKDLLVKSDQLGESANQLVLEDSPKPFDRGTLPQPQSFDNPQGWDRVNLDKLQEKSPSNMYWSYGAPTKDSAILAFRKQEKSFREKQKNNIMSRQATEDEIQDYFAYQYALSQDYIEIADLMLEHHESDLPPEGISLQKFARNLHKAKLAGIPKQLKEAIALRKEFVKERDLWLSDRKSYEKALKLEREQALLALGKPISTSENQKNPGQQD